MKTRFGVRVSVRVRSSQPVKNYTVSYDYFTR